MADEIIKLYEYFCNDPAMQTLAIVVCIGFVLFILLWLFVFGFIMKQFFGMRKEFKDFDKHFKNW
jgi:hypothetical protein